eukprot:TRINITY_DN98579_c0_g1_i1.p1 TRINITY_DN98579_c0_g1~~TRINITY_DN98579_c0_g1_i1.p1  ORF type:complete len:224 (-),score=72.84 TRINITY_DN98579_c0_g1_i1:75-746(-)
MRLYNADVDEAERCYQEDDEFAELDQEDGDGDGACKSFFDLRQRTLSGMDQLPAFRVVALGLLRKLKNYTKGSVLYPEVEDLLGRYFRLLDADMQRFASLHETLRDASDKSASSAAATKSDANAAAAHTAGVNLLHEGMREIAVVLLACSERQRESLDMKIQAQRLISESGAGKPPLASFGKYADFIEEALALGDQLRRKHEELQQQRIRAMAKITEAKLMCS